MAKQFLKFFQKFSLVTQFMIAVWIAMGTLYPLVTMVAHKDAVSNLWVTHLDLFFASILAITVETSVLFFLLALSVELRNKTVELKEMNRTLDDTVFERTSHLEQALVALEQLASTDSLTKIDNRRKIKALLRDEFRRTERTKREFAIFMLDIDHFKMINDTHGHAKGDEILIAVAQTIQQALRDIDHVGRYGGEEFVVILPETDVLAAADVATRVNTAINAININGIFVTASIGMATNKFAATVEAMLELADQAMYAAKDEGRNTIRIAAISTEKVCTLCPKQANCQNARTKFVPINCEFLHQRG